MFITAKLKGFLTQLRFAETLFGKINAKFFTHERTFCNHNKEKGEKKLKACELQPHKQTYSMIAGALADKSGNFLNKMKITHTKKKEIQHQLRAISRKTL